jgi:Clostripain family
MAKEWTIMVYMASSANIRGAALESLLRIKEVGSTKHFDVFAQVDSSERGVVTKRYHLQHLKGNEVEEAQATLKALHELQPGTMQATLRGLIEENPALFEEPSERGLGTIQTSVKVAEGTDLAKFIGRIPRSDKVKRELENELRKKGVLQKIAKNPDLLLDLLEIMVLESALVDDQPELVHDKPERLVGVSAGDPEVLRDFIQWGIDKGEARYNMVILWGHGDGFSIAGAATLRDLLRPEELAQAFRTRPRVDIVGFNSCMMGMLEVYHELRGVVKIGVASEGFAPETSWPYDRILGFLEKKGNVAPEDLARKIVQEYLKPPNGHRYTDREVDLAVCDLSRSRGVADALRGLVNILLQADQDIQLTDAIIASRLDVQTYQSDYVDLYHFCELLSKNCDQWEVREACSNVMGSIKDGGSPMVMKCGHAGDGVKNSFGVSIYFPSGEVSRRYRSLKIEGIGWEKFLKVYLHSIEDLSKSLATARKK